MWNPDLSELITNLKGNAGIKWSTRKTATKKKKVNAFEFEITNQISY